MPNQAVSGSGRTLRSDAAATAVELPQYRIITVLFKNAVTIAVALSFKTNSVRIRKKLVEVLAGTRRRARFIMTLVALAAVVVLHRPGGGLGETNETADLERVLLLKRAYKAEPGASGILPVGALLLLLLMDL